jgi:hypothetical protein
MLKLATGVFVAFGLIGTWGIASHGAPAPAVRTLGSQRALPVHAFVCPSGRGICTWGPNRGWRTFWAGQGADLIQDFRETVDGRIVLLLRGHAAPGTILVFAANGSLQAIKELSGQSPFPAVVGDTLAGDVVLCDSQPEPPHCDVRLPGPRGLSGFPEFPSGCLYPRFLAEGSAICFQDVPDAALSVSVPGERPSRQKIKAPSSLIEDMQPLPLESISFLSGSSLHVWSRNRLQEVAADNVLWMTRIGDNLFYTDCEIRVEGYPVNCKIKRLMPDLSSVVIWKSKNFVPTMLYEAREGGFWLDAWAGDARELRHLSATGKEKVLWVGKSHS